MKKCKPVIRTATSIIYYSNNLMSIQQNYQGGVNGNLKNMVHKKILGPLIPLRRLTAAHQSCQTPRRVSQKNQ